MNNKVHRIAFILLLASISLIVNCRKEEEKKETVTDIDGNVYHTVTVGSQTWMVENLKVTHYLNGYPIEAVNDENSWSKIIYGAYCNYNFNDSNSAIYGRLYNWAAVKTSLLTPLGWHIPTHTEWETLVDYLGGEEVAGIGLKEAGSVHWSDYPSTQGNNASGFAALPGGQCMPFHEMSTIAVFWSSTDYNEQMAWNISMRYNSIKAPINTYFKTAGFSVRCIKD